jgi:hypothetical protein
MDKMTRKTDDAFSSALIDVVVPDHPECHNVVVKSLSVFALQ